MPCKILYDHFARGRALFRCSYINSSQCAPALLNGCLSAVLEWLMFISRTRMVDVYQPYSNG